LQAASLLATEAVRVEQYSDLERMPHFNPDLARNHSEVLKFCAQVNGADALLIACPEYARGVPGSLKNALDWLVGDPDFYGKPVAIINVSPRSQHAVPALALILKTMSAKLVADANLELALPGKPMTAMDIATREEFAKPIRSSLRALARACRSQAS